MNSNQNQKRTSVACKVLFAALLFLFVVVLSSPSALYAQNYAGTIRGTVTDPSGAAVAGASVTATNLGTNATKTATTSDLGSFTIPDLPVGTYEVHIRVGSFKEFITKNVEVHTSSVTEVNAQLTMGAATETVTVEASDVQVETTSAAVGEVITGSQLRELPLNGENFMGLVTLSPGVSPANSFNGRDKGLAGGSDFSVNGNPYTNNLFLVDGVNNVDMGSGRTILVYPSVDAIAEFKMIRNSYGTEYGQASGAIISINTRSGENKFHGGFFYSGRNDKLNANDFFSNQNNTGKAKLRRNDFGYNFSGPAIKDKLFFWWNQEWNYEIRGQSFAACVANPAEVAGDFSSDVTSALAYLNANPGKGAGDVGNATTCGAPPPANFTNNGTTQSPAWTATSKIPVAFQGANPYAIATPDAVGSLLAAFYPSPNIAGATGFGGANNWSASEPNKLNWREENARVDYDLTKKHRLTFRWTRDTWTNPAPNGGAFWGDSFFTNATSDWSQPSRSVMAKLTSQLSDTMVNDFHFGWGYNAIITTVGAGGDLVSQLDAAYPNVWPTQKLTGQIPTVGWGGWGGLTPYGSSQTIWNIAPYANHEDLYTMQDNLQKVHGNHIFKVGAFWSSNAKVENNNGGNDRPVVTPFDGGVASSGYQTGNPLTNILLPGTGANPQKFQITENSINPNDHRIWHDFEWYIADSFKLRRNLTLDLGFRWSFFFETYSQSNQQASFSLAAWSASEAAANPGDACNGVIIVPGTHPCDDAKSALSALGVDLPLSSGTPGPNAALVANNHHNIAPRIGIAWDVKGDGKTAIRVGVGQYYQRELVGIARSLSGTAPFVINAKVDRSLDTAPALSSNISVSPNASKDPRGVTPNSWQWNLSVERELGRNTALELGYVGNTGIHLTSMQDLNSILPENWLQAAFTQGGAPNSLRQASNFGQIGQFARRGHATYHSLQALFRTKTSNFSSFQASYTYSHSIGDVELDNSSGGINQEATTDQSHPFLDKSNTNINRPHIFVANEVFYLPKFSKSNGFVRRALGEWQVNSIITAETGTSQSVFGSAGANSLTYTSPVDGSQVQVNSPLSSLIGTGFTSNNRPLKGSVSCNSGEKGNQIFNPDAFTLVGYHLGTVDANTVSRGICYGPKTTNFDVQLAKNWTFKERFRIKFSVDMFNMFNHANFNTSGLANGYGPGGLHCDDSVGPCGMRVTVDGTGVHSAQDLTNNVVTSQGNGGLVNNFGLTHGVKPGRELQYALKFTF